MQKGKEIPVSLVGWKVEFYLKNEPKTNIGTIADKVNVPLASGTNSYTPMDHYLIVDNDGDFHLVNPINLKKLIEEPKKVLN